MYRVYVIIIIKSNTYCVVILDHNKFAFERLLYVNIGSMDASRKYIVFTFL